jgi:hypothetical protein
MATERCEFCGKFGAHAERYHDPRFSEYMTLYLCARCRDKQLEWHKELEQERIARGETLIQPQERPKVSRW